MPSKYPSVTAAKAKAAKPANYPKGPRPPAANDNRLGKVVLEKLPKAVVPKTVPKLNFVPRLITPADILASGADLFNMVYQGLIQLSSRPDPRYWVQLFANKAWDGFGHVVNTSLNTGNVTSQDAWWAPVWTGSGNQYILGAPPNPNSYFSFVFHNLENDAPQGQAPYRETSMASGYRRASGAPVPTPYTVVPRIIPVTLPAVLPAPAPQAVPLAYPMATPIERPSWEAPKFGDEPAKAPDPSPWPKANPSPKIYILPPMPVPFIRMRPQPIPTVQPGTVVTFDPVTDGVFIERVQQHASPAPIRINKIGREKEVEKKTNVAIVGGVLWTGLNTTTEAMDFVVAMYKSVPESYWKNKYGKWFNPVKASKAQKIKYMLTDIDAWRNIDLAEGLQNYINMQIGDYFAALGSQQTKKLAQELGVLTGVDKAFADMQEGLGTQEVLKELTPELDIDYQSGEVSVTGPLGVLKLKFRR